MGACLSSDETRRRSRAIDRQIAIERREVAKGSTMPTLLLLGPGDSGKTTCLRQFILQHSKGFSHEDRIGFVPAIRLNVVRAFAMIAEAITVLNLVYENADSKVRVLVRYAASIGIFQNLQNVIGALSRRLCQFYWSDKTVQGVLQYANEFNITDNCTFFFEKLEAVFDDRYEPTDQDILCMRTPTEHVSEHRFLLAGAPLRIFDVGGQRNVRARWISYFTDATLILFVASLSAYDQKLEEDGLTNRMHEALFLFETIINNPLLADKSVMLFLNKIDLFREKVARSPIARYFPDFTGKADPVKGNTYFANKFRRLNKYGEKRKVYVQNTCALDPKMMAKTLYIVTDVVRRFNLQAIGFGF
ncbi:guanine nucleotide binding protein, alpha subunit [Blyttiomyces helicus]|uniref:Guanine nucleotide binding protein, alpha subunit n=1 Tax=Blyttiomyces helicus TaxID=388810 RepID=A0A4P9WCJ4_9FUNG|nr:guanine nucleotide binding protein, alpha subunit [Blyttiomyces helicus]|eukprot:RKO90381.1 guanine nucleotide binding protein, alpha subunit [Blyttiomyces helicus]